MGGDLRFGVALAEDAPVLRWQQRIIEELRGVRARDVVHYAVIATDPPDRRLLMWRAVRRVPGLRAAEAPAVIRQPWTGRHTTEVDFVLSFVAGTTTQAALGAGTRFGCWSFSPGPGSGLLDHYLSGQPLVTVSLHRTGPDPGHHELLHEGVLRCDRRSFSQTLAWVLKTVSDWPVRAARTAAGNGLDGSAVPAEGLHPNGTRPVRRAPVHMLLARTEGLLRSETWNVGVAIWPGLDPDRGPVAVAPRWLPDPPRGHYLADPFPLHGGADGLTILAEDYDVVSRTGRLVTTRWEPTGAGEGPWEPAFRLRHHASYPFIVRTPEGTFCVPECLRSGEVAAWRLGEDGTWTKAGTLISGRRLVDSTLFQHHGLWWIFATDEDRGSDTNLYGWYARSFFGPWQPHPLNPLKTDVRSTRSAGPLFPVGDRLVRPAQDCSRTYGGQIVLNEIVRLDESSFEERTIGTVRIADGSAYPQGPHTLAFLAPDLVLVDGKRTGLLDLRVAVRRLLRRLANLTRRTIRRVAH